MTKKKKTKIPKRAYLDGDIIVYRTAFWAEAYDPMYIPDKLQEYIWDWTPEEVDDIVIALSCTRADNFRRELWPLYKSNRDGKYVPEYLHDTMEHMKNNYKCKLLPHIEADDILGIYASSNRGVAVTIDKDLRGVRGWHYNPMKDIELRYIDDEDAERFFCKQWMSGDSTDCIPGLWRIGPKKADKFLDEWDKDTWYKEILDLYNTEKYQPKKTCDLSHPDLALVMGQCVKILTTSNYNLKTKEIKPWCPIDV